MKVTTYALLYVNCRDFYPMKYLTALLVSLLIAAIGSSIMVLRIEYQRDQVKEDLIEMSKIKYGLFNVDEWKTFLADIVTKKVEELDLQEADRAEMHRRISDFLYKVIDDFEARYYEENSGSLGGAVKKSVASITGTFEHIRKDIPTFTDQILDFLNDERNRNAIKGFVIEKLDEYAASTFAETDYSAVEEVNVKYGQETREGSIAFLQNKIEQQYWQAFPWELGLLLIAIAAIFILIFVKSIERLQVLIILGIAMVLLFIGVLLPMIEIDARIASITFTLMGEPIQFADQVLYYKSKSILEIVHLMLFQSRIDLIGVAIMVLTFSVLFPATKLISSTAYLYFPNLGKKRFFKFMIFKSGKWSMADVMVVAIFMAYIGFDGIISEQLKQMEEIARNVDMITTNESDLLFGFYAFIAFVILSLFLSQRIKSSFTESTHNLA